jgi:hypothetical protein
MHEELKISKNYKKRLKLKNERTIMQVGKIN